MYRLIIPGSGAPLSIDLNPGEVLFVLGANGVGKSSLLQRFSNNFSGSSIRIVAHRQSWFRSNVVDITSSQKREQSTQLQNYNYSTESRFNDALGAQKPHLSMHNLLEAENILSRKIASEVRAKRLSVAESLGEELSPLEEINALLAISNIDIKISIGEREEIWAVKNGGIPYSIAELSDGERNAFLICVDVLTAPAGHLIILDEPERHLHRSIIAPLLSALVQKREDCVFVISTHDVDLPINNSKSSVLLVRGGSWLHTQATDWDVDLLSNVDGIPDDIKRDILGAKRNILFVEGKTDSLDRGLYQILFPEFSVRPQETCVEVERSLKGVRNTEALHWINAYGLIDADDRSSEEIQKLRSQGIAAVKCYSVEALYYNLDIVRLIAERISKVVGKSADELHEDATRDLMKIFKKEREHFCARVSEKKARQSVMSRLPTHKNIRENDEHPISINLKAIRDEEHKIFDRFVSEDNLNELIFRYPIRESNLCGNIVNGLAMTTKNYESAVRKLVREDERARAVLMGILSNLKDLIDE